LYFDGVLIEATYFSCSGGSTEDAVAVWGTSFPYLRATPSPGEEGAAHYTDTVSYTKTELETLLGISLTGSPEYWIGMTTYTAGGGVATMEICGHTFQGTQLRSLLKLRSTAITVTAGEDMLHFTTRGFGHRVGMSQYGAEAMAVAGSSYREILSYYYRGAVIGEAAEN
jgi:stage II sporulation protein D